LRDKRLKSAYDLAMTRSIALIFCFFAESAFSENQPSFFSFFATRDLSAKMVQQAKLWNNRHYRKGASCQCANFIGEVVTSSGGSKPKASSLARSWLEWGNRVSIAKNAIKPGDVIVTWRGSKNGNSGHILIYIGDGQCIHRPTRSKPVQVTELSIYRSKILGVRRGS